jgi:hypothetical protein
MFYNAKGISDKIPKIKAGQAFAAHECQAGYRQIAEKGRIMDKIEQNKPMIKIGYRWQGDYQIPLIALSDPPGAPPIGKYGRLRRAFLKEYKSAFYNKLLMTERLFPHLREIDEAAQSRLDSIPDREVANEIILAELIYS